MNLALLLFQDYYILVRDASHPALAALSLFFFPSSTMASPAHSVDEVSPPSDTTNQNTPTTTLEMREIYSESQNPSDRPPPGVPSGKQVTLPRPGPSAPSGNNSQRLGSTDNVTENAGITNSETQEIMFLDFVTLSKFSDPQGNVNIIVVYDLKQTVETAQTNAVEKQRPRRPDGPSREPTALHKEKHTQSRNDETAGGLKTEDAIQRDRNFVVPASESNIVSKDKGKGKVDCPEDTPTQQSPVQKRTQSPEAGPSGQKNPGGDDPTSCHLNPPQDGEDSKSTTEKDKDREFVNWFTDDTMLAHYLKRARVQTFPYNPPENLDKEESLQESIGRAAKGILRNLKDIEAYPQNVPLVFIAVGFGCLIVQKLIPLIDERPILDTISTIIFFDAPNTLSKDQEKKTPSIKLPPPSARHMQWLKVFDGWDIWKSFYDTIKREELSTVWFYIKAGSKETAPKAAGASNPKKRLPTAAGIDFVQLVQASIDLIQLRTLLDPSEPNYSCFIKEMKRWLLLKASSHKKFSAVLVQLVKDSYDLNVRDHKKRCPLHRAVEGRNDTGLRWLLDERPDLVVNQDQDGLTPLHSAIKEAVRLTRDDEEKLSSQFIIRALQNVFDDNHFSDDIKDKWGKSPWDYIPKNGPQWVKDLEEERSLPIEELADGTEVAPPKTLKDMITQANISNMKQDSACKQSKALLTQFYIEERKDGSKDLLHPQHPNIYQVIYDRKLGSRNLFATPNVLNENMRATCKWIHLPANNERWVHDLFLLQFGCNDDSTRSRRHRGSAPFDRHITPGVFQYSQNHELCSESTPSGASSITARPTEGTSTRKRTVTALFMPIFGFETDENRQKLSMAVKEVSSLSQIDSLPFNHESVNEDGLGNGKADEHNQNLIQAYYTEDEFPLHCRRTLDQFTYHMLHDTALRDTSQVMFKWQKEKEEQEEKLGHQSGGREERKNKLRHQNEPSRTLTYPLLMIDQLWLWILEDEQTVITSFPNTWELSNRFGLLRHLTKDKLKSNRQLINGSMDLANLIIQGSIDFLQREGPCRATMYGSFRSRIIYIAAQHNDRFNEFNNLVKKLDKKENDQQTKAKLTNSLFQLTAKMDLLTEIMDVKDELNTIQHVLSKQRDTLETFALLADKRHKTKANKNGNVTHSPRRLRRNPILPRRSRRQGRRHSRRSKLPLPTPPSAQPHGDQVINLGPSSSEKAEENLRLVKSNIITIRELETHAGKVQAEIEGLHSRIQKQVNAWEARFAREASEQTRYQSNITLVFTIVTVFFLPLSFLSSVFAIQIDVFPHDEKTGQLNWPVGEAMGLLFGISLGIILLVALLGFRINRISHFCDEYGKRISQLLSKWVPLWQRKKEKAEDEYTISHDSSTTETDYSWASLSELLHRKREGQARRAMGSTVSWLLPWNWRGRSRPPLNATLRVAGVSSVSNSWESEEENWDNRETGLQTLFPMFRRRKARVDDIERDSIR
ncbi:hypothetical protein F4680DRAFT_402066 [Xylaria scruposa]|nr:hypothetical protein F4680DRAFT_402066 [Xylaria scruposa]